MWWEWWDMVTYTPVAFITYTRGPCLYVTSPRHETAFLDWMLSEGLDPTKFVRETTNTVAVVCCPTTVYKKEKKEAVILQLVKK